MSENDPPVPVIPPEDPAIGSAAWVRILFGINLKVICFFLLLPVALQVSFAGRQMKPLQLSLLLGVPAVLLPWELGVPVARLLRLILAPCFWAPLLGSQVSGGDRAAIPRRVGQLSETPRHPCVASTTAPFAQNAWAITI